MVHPIQSILVIAEFLATHVLGILYMFEFSFLRAVQVQ